MNLITFVHGFRHNYMFLDIHHYIHLDKSTRGGHGSNPYVAVLQHFLKSKMKPYAKKA